jgi:hypothetical protein
VVVVAAILRKSASQKRRRTIATMPMPYVSIVLGVMVVEVGPPKRKTLHWKFCGSAC